MKEVSTVKWPDTNYSFEEILQATLDYKATIPQHQEAKKNLKILIDASLVLDVLLNRSSIFLDDAINLIDLVLSNSVNGYISEIGLRQIWEISKKLKDLKTANYLVVKLLNSFSICTVNSEAITRAKNYCLSSFETAIQLECAKSNDLDAIITLRAKEFLGCGWENVFLPSQFLSSYHSIKENNHSTISNLRSRLNQSISTEQIQSLLPEDSLSVLFDGWKIEYFDILCSKENVTSASIVLFNTKKTHQDSRLSTSSFGIGAISTLFSALDQAICKIVNNPNHMVDSIQVSNLEGGIESSVSAVVVVKHDNCKVRQFHVDENIIKSCFYAYVKAIRDIYSFNTDVKLPSESKQEIFMPTRFLIGKNDILSQYKIGERDFSESNLREICLSNQNLSGACFRNCDMSLSNLQEIDLRNSNLEGAIFNDSDLFHADLENANMYRAKLHRVKLNKANLTKVNLSNADLIEADLNNAILVEANLLSAILENAVLSETDLLRANLSGANLTNANLSGANLNGANLTNANLSGANLNGANLTNANLSGANLNEVDLNTATIDDANLSKANLSNADLSFLDLSKAVFCKPVLTDTAMPEFKIEIYGDVRIERVINLFSHFDSDHYVIYAVNSKDIDQWWNNGTGLKYRQANNLLRKKGIPINRVFIIPKNGFSRVIHEVLTEQLDYGINVRYLSEEQARDLHGFDLANTNLLVCKNILVPKNSFTTMMVVDKNNQDKGGYISYKTDDIQTNEQRFSIIWEHAHPYSGNVEIKPLYNV